MYASPRAGRLNGHGHGPESPGRSPCGRARAALAAAAALAALVSAVRAAEFVTPVAITGGHVVVRPGQVLEGATVLMEGDRIRAVGTDVAIPPHARRVDARGLWVYAGFIDAATHLGMPENKEFEEELARLGDTETDAREAPRTGMQRANRNGIWPHHTARGLFRANKAKRESHRKAGFTTALVLPRPAILAGRGDLMQMGDRGVRRSIVQRDVCMYVRPGPPGRSGPYPQGQYPVSRMGAIALLRQTLLDAEWYRQRHALAEEHGALVSRPAVDPVLEAAGEVLDGRYPLLIEANSAAEILHALDLGEEIGARVIILGGREGWKVASALTEHEAAVIATLDWPEKPALKPKKRGGRAAAGEQEPGGARGAEAGKGERGEEEASESPEGEESEEAASEPPAPLRSTRSWTPEWEDDFFEPVTLRKERQRQWRERVSNIHSLLEAGVPVAVTSLGLDGPGEVLKKLREAIEDGGLSTDEALACLTTQAAGVLGAGESLGTIEPGRIANLVIMTSSIEKKDTRVRIVVVDGEQFEQDVAEREGGRGEKSRAGRSRPGGRRGSAESGFISEKEGISSGGKAGEAKEAGEAESAEEAKEGEEEEEAGQAEERAHEWAFETDADREPRIHTGGNVLLKHATVLTVTDGTRKDCDVLIREGRIEAVGRGLEAPAGTVVLDLRGYWVMPGIIDAHSHIAAPGGLNEWSESVTPEVRVRDVLDSNGLSMYRALAGGVTAMHIMHGSANTIGGQNATIKLKYRRPPRELLIPEAAQTVKFALGENVTRANSQRSRNSRFPASRMGVESVLRQAFQDAVEYRRSWEAYREAVSRGEVADPPRRDLRLEALNAILDGEMWVHCHAYRADEMLRLMAVAEDFGFRVACFQHVLEGYRIIPEMLRHGAGASTFSDWWAYKMEAYEAIPYNAAMMARAGIATSVNSDSPEVTRHLNLEAAKAIRFGGLTADEALRLITVGPAIQLGIEDRVGSLERGKDGDVAVFTRHPLDTFSRCVLTLVEGEVYFQAPDFDPAASVPGPGSEFVPQPPREPLVIPESAGDYYAIVGATVHPVSGPAISGGVVVIRGGRIEAVGSGITPPAGATVIDARGLHLYPGLVNAAGYLGLYEVGSVPGTVDSRDIARFQPEIMAVSAINPHSAHIPVARCEGITTTAVLPRGGVVSGRAGFVQLSGWTMPEMLRAEEVGLVVSLPSLPANLEGKERRKRIEEHRRSVEEIEAFFEKAAHYARVRRLEETNGVAGVAHDVRLEAMRPYLPVQGEEGGARSAAQKPVMFRANGYKAILEAIRFAETFGLKAVIVGGRDAWKAAEQLAERDIPVIITTVFGYPWGEFERFDGPYANAARLAEAGVRFCIAADSASLVKQLPVHAGMAVAYGLDAEQAVRAITLSAAEILGVADEVGSIEVGKRADLILTSGEVCQASSRTVASFIGGKPVRLTSKHEELYARFMSRPEPALPPEARLAGPPPRRWSEERRRAEGSRRGGQEGGRTVVEPAGR